MKPIRNQVLVKAFKTDAVTQGGLIVPDSCIKDSSRVLIVAVGRGTKEKEMRLKEGMVGYRVKDWGTEVIENDEKYYLMEQDAIIAVE